MNYSKMKITKDNFSIEFDDNVLFNKVGTDNLVEILNIITGGVVNPPIEDNILTQIESIANKMDRTRLPNNKNKEETSVDTKRLKNVVDLNDYDVKKPKGYNDFRCPDCGQCIVISIDGQNYIRDINTGYVYPVDIDEDTILNTEEDYYTLLHESTSKFDRVSLTDTEEIIGTCIKCGKEHTLHEFIEAYEHPEYYIEYEHICPLCGGEMCKVVDADVKPGDVEHDLDKKVFKCEKCDYKEEVEDGEKL